METIDYDKALYYVHRQQWDKLTVLMAETRDDLLAKKIEKLLYTLLVKRNFVNAEKQVICLLSYIAHALKIDDINSEVTV